jgi:hypothetical protein
LLEINCAFTEIIYSFILFNNLLFQELPNIKKKADWKTHKNIGIMKEYVISEEIITRREFNQIIFNLRRKV